MFGKDKAVLIGIVVFLCLAVVGGLIAIVMSVGNDNQPTSTDGETVESPETAPVEHYEPEVYGVGSYQYNLLIKVFCDGPDRIYFNENQIRIVEGSSNCQGQRSVGEIIRG
jgi:hypothetical protein